MKDFDHFIDFLLNQYYAALNNTISQTLSISIKNRIDKLERVKHE